MRVCISLKFQLRCRCKIDYPSLQAAARGSADVGFVLLQVGLGKRLARRLAVQAGVVVFQPRQRLAWLDRGADVHQPGHHLAADAKRQPRLVAGADVANETRRSARCSPLK